MILALFRKTAEAETPARDLTHRVAGRDVPLRIVEHRMAKRLTLRIEPGGKGLRVTVPPGVARGEVHRFLDRQRDWLERRINKVPDRASIRPGASLPLRGKPHLIVHAPGRRGTVTIGNEDGRPALVVHGDRAHLPRRLSDFLKREARREIEPLVARHAALVGRKPKAIRFKDTVSRWGSCTSDGVLSFSWRIMMAPPQVIDYLVAHEVAHLREMNHAPAFWALCRELCPETERCKSWLKRNGSALQAIDFG